MWSELFGKNKLTLPTKDEALPGRPQKMTVAPRHVVLGTPLEPPYPSGTEQALFALGCFWGAEKAFWKMTGVVSTSVGYCAGFTENPTYQEVCSGRTGHTEAVLVVYDPARVSYGALLKAFWENHDPTQGMRQGNDVGTQYRSAAYWFDEAQRGMLLSSKESYSRALKEAGHGDITTEVGQAPTFYWAEDYHQQYLHKNPDGYCGLGGLGVSCPIGLLKT
jgi:peptide-methionine (S)-S-oxide reductase